MQMSALKINKQKTLRRISHLVSRLLSLNVSMDEIYSDIDYIGVQCCSTYKYGDFYKYYYTRLNEFFLQKINKTISILQHEMPLDSLRINEIDPHYVGQDFLDESDIKQPILVNSVDTHYSLEVML